MAKLLLEDTWLFKPIRAKITESKIGNLLALVVPGVLSQSDVVNGNKRRYAKAVWETNLKEGSKLRELISRNAAFGLLEHPSDGIVDLQSPISHAVTKVELQEDGTVTGEITVLTGPGFPNGDKLKGLMEFGFNPLVSSRGYGSVIRNQEGIDEVQVDYVCEGWDVVMTPSFVNAQLTPVRGQAAQRETLTAARQMAVIENQGTAVAGQPLTHKATVKRMDINETRQAVGALKHVDILTASPRMVAESFSQATALHRALSETQAANPGLSWDCTTLHEELNATEKRWTESIQAIREEVTKLRADREKLVLVAENMTKTARLYRTQLAETVQKRNATAKLYAEVAQHGRGWQSIAVKRGAKNAELEHQALVACAAIDTLAEQLVKAESGENRDTPVGIALNMMAKRVVQAESGENKQTPVATALSQLAEKYHTDTTKLAKHIAELRFPSGVTRPEIKEQLDKAKTADAVLDVIAALAKPMTSQADTSKPAPSVGESTKPQVLTSSTSADGITMVRVVEQLGHQLNFEQSVGIARRLSNVQKPATV